MPSWLVSRSSLLGCLPQIPILGAHKFPGVETKAWGSNPVIGLCQSHGPFLMCGQSRELKFGPTVGCQVRSLARSVYWLYYARKIIIPILSSNQVSPLTQLRSSWEVIVSDPSFTILSRFDEAISDSINQIKHQDKISDHTWWLFADHRTIAMVSANGLHMLP